MIGTVLDGRFRIVRELGAGGMGRVYEAVHVGTSRSVAVKVIHVEQLREREQALGRFEREARTAGALATRHIVDILDVGVDPASGRPYLVMELVRGRDAAAWLKRLGPLPVAVALKIAAQSCIGLKHAHAAGVVHRDIKPANLLLGEEDEEEVVVKIVDFGIAKIRPEAAGADADRGLTQTGAVIGSPLFMAPEQARGRKQIDARADLWSLGAVLYQLLCGKAPFCDIEAFGDLLMAICNEPPPSLAARAPWVPAEVVALVHLALALDPDERFQSAEEMQRAVCALLPGGSRLSRGELVSRQAADAPARPAPPAEPPEEEAEPAAPSAEPRADPAEHPEPPARATGWSLLRSGLGVLAGMLAVFAVYYGWQRLASRGEPRIAPAAATGSAAASSPRRVRVAGDSFAGFAGFRSEALARALAEAGIELRYAHTDGSAARARQLGRDADVVLLTLDEVLRHRPAGKIVALVDVSAGADALVLDSKEQPTVSSLDLLAKLGATAPGAGPRPHLAIAADSPSEYLALLLAARFPAFSLDRFALDHVSTAEQAYRALAQPGTVAAMLWEPLVTQARREGYRVALSSADVPDAVVDVAVASDRLLAEQGDVVHELVQRYYRQIDGLLLSRSDMLATLAADGHLDHDESESVLASIRFLSSLQAERWLREGTLGKQIGATAAVLVLAGRLAAAPADPAALVDGRHVMAAAAATRTQIEAIRAANPILAARIEGREERTGAVDVSRLLDGAEVGQLGALRLDPSSARPDATAEQTLALALARLRDFNSATTALLVRGHGADAAAGEELARVVLGWLPGRGVEHAMAATGVAATSPEARGLVELVLVRPAAAPSAPAAGAPAAPP